MDYNGNPGISKHKMSDNLSCRTRCSSCLKFIHSCEQKFGELIMKAAFVFLVLYQSFEKQVGYNAITNLPEY